MHAIRTEKNLQRSLSYVSDFFRHIRHTSERKRRNLFLLEPLLSEQQRATDFPLIDQQHVAYLDSAATALKPVAVIEAITEYYSSYPANVHRGIYAMSERASEEYEKVRDAVREFVGAREREEIIFTSGTTQSLNMAAQMLGQQLKPGDEILLTDMEHHANLIPWQMIAQKTGAVLKFLKTDATYSIDTAQFAELLNERTKICAFTHISNASGYIMPIAELTALAHKNGSIVVLDAAQSVPHMPVDVQALDVDLMAFSGHKLYGPTGVGVLYGKRALLETFEPVFGGGSMISDVTLESATWAELPLRLEPGTPNIAGVIGLGAALQYVNSLSMNAIHAYEAELTAYAREQLSSISGLTLYTPPAAYHAGIFSFTLEGIHPHDIASVLDHENVAVRAGHHCAQPLMKKWNVPATVRASIGLYTTGDELDRLVSGITKAQTIFTQ